MKKERVEAIIGIAWVMLALVFLGSLGVVTYSSTNDMGAAFDLSRFTYENIASNAKIQVNFYLMLGTLSFVFFMKEREIMEWLERNAPF
jgi:hypothetical protein